MRTSRRIEGALTYFIIRELEEKYRDAVKHLYYDEENGIFFKSFPSDSRHIDKCYQNFEKHIQEIILQRADVRPVPWRDALSAFLEKVAGKEIDWWLCGSAALAARGIDVAPHDIDIITDETGALKLGEILQDYLVEPVVNCQGWICKLFGNAFLFAEIGWAGAVEKSVDMPKPTDFGPTAAQRLETVRWCGYKIQVPPLDLQLWTSERRGLVDRVEKIKRAMG